MCGTDSQRVRLLLYADPLTPREPDSAFESENEAIKTLELDYDLLDFESLIAGDTDRALRRVVDADLALLVYRGWMLPVGAYSSLEKAIADRGGHLINDAAAYERSHHLPGSYAVLAGHTPKTVWLEGAAPFEMAQVHDALSAFDGGPVIVKDFVKSRKHEWEEACYIPSTGDPSAVERVVRTFVDRQGEDLAGGLVFREFVELDKVGFHPRSGLGLGREYRLFFLDGELLASGRYWKETEYDDEIPAEPFSSIATSIESRFFSIDIARTAAGEWIVIEIGDGQVTGLPDTIDATDFYRTLSTRLGARD